MRGYKRWISLSLGLICLLLFPGVAGAQAELPEPGVSMEGHTVILFTGDINGRAEADKEQHTMGFTMVSGLKKPMKPPVPV